VPLPEWLHDLPFAWCVVVAIERPDALRAAAAATAAAPMLIAGTFTGAPPAAEPTPAPDAAPPAAPAPLAVPAAPPAPCDKATLEESNTDRMTASLLNVSIKTS